MKIWPYDAAFTFNNKSYVNPSTQITSYEQELT